MDYFYYSAIKRSTDNATACMKLENVILGEINPTHKNCRIPLM